MSNKIYIVILFTCTLFMAGCEKDVDNIKLPTTDPKLVVGCFISPQDAWIHVTLTRSNPIFGPGHSSANSQPVTDASVIISNGSSTASIPFQNANELYELSAAAFPILPGQTYTLAVSTPKGENVTGTCTVPFSNLSSMTVDFTDTSAAYSAKKLDVKWTDISSEVNYYRVFGQTVSVDTVNTGDTVYYDMYSITGAIYNDQEKDGHELYSKLEGYGYYEQDYKLIAYDLYILNIDAAYYNYQKSLQNYTYGDPFSEPSPLYTNIQGGLGIFAAYQKFHVRYP